VSTPHQMTRMATPEQGVEEWACTECSRRLLIHRPPAFEQVVLERGDEWAAHVGSTGGAQAAAMHARPTDVVSLSDRERGWLADHGITWEPDGNP
jgi:hypothetical protein